MLEYSLFHSIHPIKCNNNNNNNNVAVVVVVEVELFLFSPTNERCNRTSLKPHRKKKPWLPFPFTHCMAGTQAASQHYSVSFLGSPAEARARGHNALLDSALSPGSDMTTYADKLRSLTRTNRLILRRATQFSRNRASASAKPYILYMRKWIKHGRGTAIDRSCKVIHFDV